MSHNLISEQKKLKPVWVLAAIAVIMLTILACGDVDTEEDTSTEDQYLINAIVVKEDQTLLSAIHVNLSYNAVAGSPSSPSGTEMLITNQLGLAEFVLPGRSSGVAYDVDVELVPNNVYQVVDVIVQLEDKEGTEEGSTLSTYPANDQGVVNVPPSRLDDTVYFLRVTIVVKNIAEAVAAADTPTPVPTSTFTSTPEPTPTFTDVPPEEPQDVPTEEAFTYGPEAEDFPPGINPMTCLAVSDPDSLVRPAVLMSITNWPPEARPQAGPSFAPAIYEIYIGEGMTRFLTVFYGDVPAYKTQINGDHPPNTEPFKPGDGGVLGDRVWLDDNQDGIQDEGEVGIPGVAVELFDVWDGTTVDTTTTDSFGNYAFNVVPDREYIIHFVLPYTFKFSPQNATSDMTKDSDADPTTGDTFLILATHDQDLTWDAGLIYLEEQDIPGDETKEGLLLGDRAWYDTNENGIQDKREFGLSDVAVTLADKDLNILDTTVTDFAGNFFFDVEPGEYLLRFKQPANTGGYSPQYTAGDEKFDSNVTSLGWTDVLIVEDDDYTVDAGFIPPPGARIVGPLRSVRQAYNPFIRFFGPDACLVGVSKDATLNVPLCSYVYGTDFEDINSAGVSPESIPDIAEKNADSGIEPNYTGNMCSTIPPEGGVPADSILAFWSYLNQAMFVYDPLHNGFLRFDDRDADGAGNFVPSTDRMTGEQLLFNNVVILWVTHTTDRQLVYDLEMDNSEGHAAVFRDGMLYQDLLWSTLNEAYELETHVVRPVKLRNPDGTPFPMSPGNTWYFIATLNSELWEPEQAGAWKFRYYPPAGVD